MNYLDWLRESNLEISVEKNRSGFVASFSPPLKIVKRGRVLDFFSKPIMGDGPSERDAIYCLIKRSENSVMMHRGRVYTSPFLFCDVLGNEPNRVQDNDVGDVLKDNPKS